MLIIFLLISWSLILNLSNPDETFTLRLIQHSFKGIISLDALDVHPPLYYLLLKAFFDITFINHCSPFIQIIAGRIFSLIISALTLIVLSKLLTKITNNNVTFKYLLLLVLFPSVLYYATNIRMYSLAALFIACELNSIYNFNTTNKLSSLWWLIFFAICAAWTHYFAAVTAGLLLLYNFINYLGKKQIKKSLLYAGSGIALIIGFLPWAMISMHQLSSVDASYWIKDNLFNYIGMFCYTQLSTLTGTTIATIFAIILAILIAVISVKAFKQNNNSIFKQYYLMITIVFIGTVLCGLIISLIMRPIFISRYAYPVFLTYLAFTLLLITPYLRCHHRLLKISLVTMLSVGVAGNLALGAFNLIKDTKIIKTIHTIKQDKSKLFNNTKNQDISLSIYYSYCLPDKEILVNQSEAVHTVQSPKLFKAVYPNIKFVQENNYEEH